jgi:hypothetical protein
MREPEQYTKIVKVMADYNHPGICKGNGINFDPDDYPITSGLRRRLAAWSLKYRGIDLSDKQEVIAYAEKGLDLAREVKRELPAATVIYLDEALRCRHTEFRAAPEYYFNYNARMSPHEYEVLNGH